MTGEHPGGAETAVIGDGAAEEEAKRAAKGQYQRYPPLGAETDIIGEKVLLNDRGVARSATAIDSLNQVWHQRYHGAEADIEAEEHGAERGSDWGHAVAIICDSGPSLWEEFHQN
jgi:hypothetical protein